MKVTSFSSLSTKYKIDMVTIHRMSPFFSGKGVRWRGSVLQQMGGASSSCWETLNRSLGLQRPRNQMEAEGEALEWKRHEFRITLGTVFSKFASFLGFQHRAMLSAWLWLKEKMTSSGCLCDKIDSWLSSASLSWRHFPVLSKLNRPLSLTGCQKLKWKVPVCLI